MNDVIGPVTYDTHLRVDNLHKSFGEVQALKGASLDLRRGEIHALVGGNGSGKSTLIKILAGVYSADSGQITTTQGEFDATNTSPRLAKDLGLGFVHQDAGVFGSLTVAENLAVGTRYQRGRFGNIDWKAMRASATEILERYEIDATPKSLLEVLSPAVRMQIAIARCLEEGRIGLGLHSSTTLVLDEPTASLTAKEVDQLTAALRRFAAAGETILFVSHRLDEVFGLSDRMTVLRDGVTVASRTTSDVSKDELIEMMLGRPADEFAATDSERVAGRPLLEVTSLSTGPVDDISLVVREREIVGLVGLLGSGRSELLHAIFGSRTRRGDVSICGRALPAVDIGAAMSLGVALVPENRIEQAIFPDRDLTDNVTSASLSSFKRSGLWRMRDAVTAVRVLCSDFGVKSAGTHSLISGLSGGNQQKVVLARWLARKPRLLMLDEPTQGVDISSRSDIYRMIREFAQGEAGVLVASSDFEELSLICDRVLVLRDGAIVASEAGPLSVHRITQLSYGVEE